MKSISLYFVLCIISIPVILASCQKEPEVTDIDPVPTMPVFDSTQLIKDIKLVYYLSDTQLDSVTETYSYDTVNRRITTTWTSLLPVINGISYVYSYNPAYLLTSIVAQYPAAYTPAAGDLVSVVIDYDNEGIVKKININYTGMSPYVINYTKTITGTGYRLGWEEIDVLGLLNKYTALFNDKHKCLKFQWDRVETDLNGNRTDSFYIHTDTLRYTSGGELQKVNRTSHRIPGPPNQFLHFEFGSRYDKGDQLSKQRRLLFNGIDHIPIDEQMNGVWFFSSVTDVFYIGYARSQFDGFPCKTSFVDFNGSEPRNITHAASFDSLDRLVSFNGIEYAEEPKERIWKLTYYK